MWSSSRTQRARRSHFHQLHRSDAPLASGATRHAVGFDSDHVVPVEEAHPRRLGLLAIALPHGVRIHQTIASG